MNAPQEQQENDLQELLTTQNSTRNNSKMLLYIIIITCFVITIIIVIIIASQSRKDNLEKAERDSRMKQLERNLERANIEVANLRAENNNLKNDRPTYETQENVMYEVDQPVEKPEQTMRKRQRQLLKTPPNTSPGNVEKKLPPVKEQPAEEEEDYFDPEKIIEK
jgi:cell division protein FtsN